jgi:hypothetical protein
MNGPEDNVKRFTLSSGPFIKGLMLFSLRGWEFPDHQAREFTPDECFNPPLELFGPGWSISTLRAHAGQFRLKRCADAHPIYYQDPCAIFARILLGFTCYSSPKA